MRDLPVLVTDMGGVMYSFSKNFNAREHEDMFEQVISQYGPTVDELEAENVAIGKWFNDARGKEVLPVYFVPSAFHNLAKNLLSHKVVVVSTSKVETSRLILQKGFAEIGVESTVADSVDFYNMAGFGSKKDTDAWVKVLKMYSDIKVIVEDNEQNLAVAGQAVDAEANGVKLSTVMNIF